LLLFDYLYVYYNMRKGIIVNSPGKESRGDEGPGSSGAPGAGINFYKSITGSESLYCRDFQLTRSLQRHWTAPDESGNYSAERDESRRYNYND
jgi:hypothetical protein